MKSFTASYKREQTLAKQVPSLFYQNQISGFRTSPNYKIGLDLYFY